MRPTPLPRRPAAPLRDRVLGAADTLFASLGPSRTSMEAVARLAGARKMSVYRLFASKAELVCAWLEMRQAVESAGWAARRPLHPARARRRLAALLRLSRASTPGRALGLAEPDDLSGLGPKVALRLMDRADLQLQRLEVFCREAGAADPALAAWTLACFLQAAAGAQALLPSRLDPRRLADLVLRAGARPAPPLLV